MHIAIIGAGISGLACGRQLQNDGHTVTVFEKLSDVGGRATTFDTELGGYDSGAQFFTAQSNEFKKEVATWRAAGVAVPWHGNLVRLEEGVIKPGRASSQRFVAAPGMGELTRYLAKGLDVRTGHAVKRVEPTGKPAQQWMLTVLVDGVKQHEGPFDAVVAATPADIAAHLLKAAPNLSSKAEMIEHVSCWSLMLAFPQSLELPYDGAWLGHPRLTWIARDTSKPDRRVGERWTALARVEWSEEHSKDSPTRARDKLLKAFQEATGSQVQPIQSAAKLWNYAQSTKPLAKSCLWDEKLKAGACGDWFSSGLEGSGLIEHAFMSGVKLALRIGK